MVIAPLGREHLLSPRIEEMGGLPNPPPEGIKKGGGQKGERNFPPTIGGADLIGDYYLQCCIER